MASENENEKRKTVTDILAECRNDADAMDRGELYQPTTEYVRRLLDRIEAAWKRQEQCYLDQIRDAVNMIGHERFVKEHPPVGNAAAMREALVELTDKVLDYLHKGLIQLPLPLENATAKARAAFSAPARNCDKYNTAEDAYDAYDEITHADIDKYDECRQNCPMCDEKLYIPCVVKWLFAPAAERKGECDEQK